MKDKTLTLNPIGKVDPPGPEGFPLVLNEDAREALTGLEGFSHINIIWWADQLDDPAMRSIRVTDKLGLFATRSPVRPNPVMITVCSVARIDFESGIVYTRYIDAEPGSPVLDIKPYHGSTDRVDSWSVPEWSAGWPKTVEESAHFNWEGVFNF